MTSKLWCRAEKSRVTFDDSRRDIYDAAIRFEYDNGSPDAAWSYLQKYRAKLFLEFLLGLKDLQNDSVDLLNNQSFLLHFQEHIGVSHKRVFHDHLYPN